MRYNNYLIESKDQLSKKIDIIHKECSDYFKYVDNKYPYLYRGVRKTSKFKNVPRNDRISHDVPEIITNIIDKKLEQKFGWRPRTEGVFATSDMITAKTYGKLYYFFPSNGFKMIWSWDINDLWLYLQQKGIISFYQNNFIEEMVEFIDSFVISKYNQGYAKDINKAIYSGNEILFKCSYYLIEYDIVQNNINKIWS